MTFPSSCICSAGVVAAVIIIYWALWRYRYFPDIEKSFFSWVKDKFKR
jgi:hypothetical protein